MTKPNNVPLSTGKAKNQAAPVVSKRQSQPGNSPAPSTPKKKKQKTQHWEGLAPGVTSPKRMMNGTYCRGCDHGDAANLTPYEKNYFSVEWCQKENYPTQCHNCKHSLVAGAEGRCDIGGYKQVHCCQNSINHREHDCTFALCHDCWIQLSQEQVKGGRRQGRRDRTRRSFFGDSPVKK